MSKWIEEIEGEEYIFEEADGYFDTLRVVRKKDDLIIGIVIDVDEFREGLEELLEQAEIERNYMRK